MRSLKYLKLCNRKITMARAKGEVLYTIVESEYLSMISPITFHFVSSVVSK